MDMFIFSKDICTGQRQMEENKIKYRFHYVCLNYQLVDECHKQMNEQIKTNGSELLQSRYCCLCIILNIYIKAY